MNKHRTTEEINKALVFLERVKPIDTLQLSARDINYSGKGQDPLFSALLSKTKCTMIELYGSDIKEAFRLPVEAETMSRASNSFLFSRFSGLVNFMIELMDTSKFISQLSLVDNECSPEEEEAFFKAIGKVDLVERLCYQ